MDATKNGTAEPKPAVFLSGGLTQAAPTIDPQPNGECVNHPNPAV
jgi:hypothetical protein